MSHPNRTDKTSATGRGVACYARKTGTTVIYFQVTKAASPTRQIPRRRINPLSTVGMQPIYNMFDAVINEQVDVVTAYSTDCRIAAHELLVLADPKQAVPPDDAILPASPEASKNPALIDALSGLVNKIDDDLMCETNRAGEVDGETPESGARNLLATIQPN